MLSQSLGPWLYAVVFCIVFAETGLVITPFLPGDSLLFALGSLTSIEGANLSIGTLSVVLLCATFFGDNANYFIGKKLGAKVFQSTHSRFFNRNHLLKTQEFYSKYGKKAVILARFIPIVRTFVPFVAGIGRMPYGQYLTYSMLGSAIWTQSFLWAGNLFGGLDIVKRNFQIVILGVILISVLPGIIGWYRTRSKNPLKS